MRGKSKVWAFAAICVGILAVSMIGVQRAYAENTISISPALVSGKPGDGFHVHLVLDDAWMVRGWELTVSWNPKILRLNSSTPIVEGPFLSRGGPTIFVKSIGVAGSVTAANIITAYSSVDGGGVLATVYFEVLAGGTTGISVDGRMLDLEFYDMYPTFVGGMFVSAFPMIDLKWYVPTAVQLSPQGFAEVEGYGYYTTSDPDGDMDYHPLPPTTRVKPILALDDNGAPESVVNVESGTLFFGDNIIFDASATYDFDNNGQPAPLDPTAFRWIIRAAGQNTITYRKVTYDSRYESGVELDYGPVINYTFPGDLPDLYKLYGPVYLGWFDLTLEVTDSDLNVATYHSWIRIFRICPARTVMININNPTHSLSEDGNTMILGGKMQNRGGASDFPYDALSVYLELARMIHGNFWGRLQFNVTDVTGDVVSTVYTDAVWLGATEIPIGHMEATWTIPPEVVPGLYTVSVKGQFCASGVTFGFSARGTPSKVITILP